MAYYLLGWSDTDTCDCCGRRDLERTMRVIDDSGDISYFGSSCGARKLGFRGSAAKLQASVTHAEQQLARFEAEYWDNARLEEIKETNPEKWVKLHGQKDVARARFIKEGMTDVALFWHTKSPAQQQAALLKQKQIQGRWGGA